jgi:hypothetical protein
LSCAIGNELLKASGLTAKSEASDGKSRRNARIIS